MSIEKTEKKTEAVKEAQPVTETTGAAAYCGPTVKGIAPQYTVFVDGLPEKLKEKVTHVFMCGTDRIYDGDCTCFGSGG